MPPTYLEQKRAEAQLQYKEEVAYLEANKPNLDKMIEEERAAMLRDGAGSLLGALQVFTGPPPPPGPPPASAPAAPAGETAKTA